MTLNRSRLVFWYAVFAAIAIACNFGVQLLVISIYSGDFSIPLSILFGTLAGLPVKYLLDKRYIFRFVAKNLKHDTKLFVLYSVLAVVTTLIFWIAELSFQAIFNSEVMRFVGGALGLTVGYVVKYALDKRFVFIDELEGRA